MPDLPMTRRERRQWTRRLPHRICAVCGADLNKVIDYRSHVARHGEQLTGVPRRLVRRYVTE